jgi:hypothetical protein
MPIDMSLLKDFRCVLTVPKGGLVRQQQEDGSWSVVRSPIVCEFCIVPLLQIESQLKQGCLQVSYLRAL